MSTSASIVTLFKVKFNTFIIAKVAITLAGMNTEFRVFPTLGRVVNGLANVDPPVAQRLVDRYLARMPLE